MNSREVEVRGYCSQCSCWCPTISHVKEGLFHRVQPDYGSSFASELCAKALAAPELVYNAQRLKYPIRRTTPKSSSDPGWQRISWDEALDISAAKLLELKAEYGAESIAFARSGPGGSPMGEVGTWVTRLANAFGSPNNIATTHICQWHRDCCSAYTYGNVGSIGAAGRAEFERSGCILIWGNNIHATRRCFLPLIKKGLTRGAKLIVVDPRRTEIASMADIWVQPRPGTDLALALCMLNIMMEEELYDALFTRDWTNSPFLIRSDSGDYLSEGDYLDYGRTGHYVIIDEETRNLVSCCTGTRTPVRPVLDAGQVVEIKSGKEVECKTAFRLLREACAECTPRTVERITGVPMDKIRKAVRMFALTKPACWYSWNGIEQSITASQTNRAICILYALTGNYDTPGGNVLLPRLPTNPVLGGSLLEGEIERKRLGLSERPLGPGGVTWRSTQAYEVYRAILEGEPYMVKGLIGFGGNIVMSNPPSQVAKKAISQLNFHVQAELFRSPTAHMADIVLPAASSWESWHMGMRISPLSDKVYVQVRPAVVPPQHEAWPDMKIIFELAKRLGLGDNFFGGDIEAAFNYQLSPLGITVEQVMKSENGVWVNLPPMKYQKFMIRDHSGQEEGFPTPSKRVEVYSSIFKANGYDAVPKYDLSATNWGNKYPFLLTVAKVDEFCHSQHRSVPLLRKRIPYPFLEINTLNAQELDLRDGELVRVETPHGSITLRAKPTDGILYNVVCTQNGWWQSCSELALPGYDPFTGEGANVNLLYSSDDVDPISGSLPLKGYPCSISKI